MQIMQMQQLSPWLLRQVPTFCKLLQALLLLGLQGVPTTLASEVCQVGQGWFGWFLNDEFTERMARMTRIARICPISKCTCKVNKMLIQWDGVGKDHLTFFKEPTVQDNYLSWRSWPNQSQHGWQHHRNADTKPSIHTSQLHPWHTSGKLVTKLTHHRDIHHIPRLTAQERLWTHQGAHTHSHTHAHTHTATHSNAHEFCSACFRNGVAKSQSWSVLPLKNVEKRCLFCCSYCLHEHVYNVSIMRNFPKCLAWRQTAFMRFMTGSTGIAPPAEWCNSSHEILETMWKHDMKCYEYQCQYPWMDFNAWLSMALASSVTKNILNIL